MLLNDLGCRPMGDGADPEPVNAVAAEIAAAGGEAATSSDDVGRPDAAAGIIQQAIDRWGRIRPGERP